MDLHILIFLTLVGLVTTYTSVLKLDHYCSPTSYRDNTVSEDKSYLLTYRGINPPRACDVGFQAGYNSKVCLEVTEYNIDCNVVIRYFQRSYNCTNKPTGKICSTYGGYLMVGLTAYSRQSKYSSFKFHITQGDIKNTDPEHGDNTALIIFVVIGAFISACFLMVCIVYKCKNKRSYGRANTMTATNPEIRIQDHSVQQRLDLNGQETGDRIIEYDQPPVDLSVVNQEPRNNVPTLFNEQNEVLQTHQHQRQQDRYFDTDVPPPSYEEANKYII